MVAPEGQSELHLASAPPMTHARRMSAAPDANLERLVDHIAKSMAPLQIWLFGSRAEGRARPNSDYDLLVVMSDETPEAELDSAKAWHLGRDVRVLADIVPCTLAEFEEEKAEPGTLPSAAFRRGRKVYER